MKPEPYDEYMDKKASEIPEPDTDMQLSGMQLSLGKGYILIKNSHNNALLDEALTAIQTHLTDYHCITISKNQAKDKVNQYLNTCYGKEILELLEHEGCIANCEEKVK